METIVHDQSPLAQYLNDETDHEQPPSWPVDDGGHVPVITPPPSPPNPSFAPTGRPIVKPQFRSRTPKSLSIVVTPRRRGNTLSAGATAVASRIDRADNAKCLERFRYTIITSQLLSGHATSAYPASALSSAESPASQDGNAQIPDEIGLILTAMGAATLAWLINWLAKDGFTNLTRKRGLAFLTALALAALGASVWLKQRRVIDIRNQTINDITAFVTSAQEFDSVVNAAIVLVQEVELVSRGYRISAPLPPISRIEECDRGQTRRCNRLRMALRMSFNSIMEKYQQVNPTVKSLSEPLDLERYYDIYDLSDLDMADAAQGYSEQEFEDMETLRALKIIAARLHVMRKMFLCTLLAIEAPADGTELARWEAVVESLQTVNEAAVEANDRIKKILSEEDSFSIGATPERMPMSPGRERWRTNLRKLGSLTTGIRGLQAKMALLREESDRALTEADDVSEFGPSLMLQYESIGQDLRMLQQAWEDGRLSLASGIHRHEQRLSSISGVLSSPTASVNGLATVDEDGDRDGGAAAALRALNRGGGGSETAETADVASSSAGDSEEVFEAVVSARPRSIYTSREERLAKMREDREKRAEIKERADGHRGMLKELEMVINLRPHRAKSTTPAERGELV